MCKYVLSNGSETIVDPDIYKHMALWSWHLVNGYVGRNAKPGEHIYLHRLIMDAPEGIEVDHINHNKLDNRRENLRLATRLQNARNCYGYRGNTKVGVSYFKLRKKWRAYIWYGGKHVHIGLFKTKNEALVARQEMRLLIWEPPEVVVQAISKYRKVRKVVRV